MQPIYVTKSLIAASSSGLGVISSATPPVVTIKTSTLDTQRRISLSATADFSATYKITGTREGNGILTETIVGSTAAGAAATTQDFLTITSVTVSSALGIPVQIGTNTQGGTPWKIVNTAPQSIAVGCALVFSTTANSMAASGEYTLDDPTGVYPSPNQVPVAFISTGLSTATSNTANLINPDGPQYLPIAAWRITLTSSSSAAGSITASVIQSGR